MKKISLVGFLLAVCACMFSCRSRSDSNLAGADSDVTGGAQIITVPKGLPEPALVHVETIPNLTHEDWEKNCNANVKLAVTKAEADPDIKAFPLPAFLRGASRICQIATIKKSDLKETYYGFAERILDKGIFASPWNAGENIQSQIALTLYNRNEMDANRYGYDLGFRVTLRSKFKNSADNLPTYSYFLFSGPKVILSNDNVSAIGIKFIDDAFKDLKSPNERKDLENFNWDLDICKEENRNLTTIEGDATLELFQGMVTKTDGGDVAAQAWLKFRPTYSRKCVQGQYRFYQERTEIKGSKQQQIPLKPVK